MAYWLWNGHVTDAVTWPQRRCEAVRSAIVATAWLLVLVGISQVIGWEGWVFAQVNSGSENRLGNEPPKISVEILIQLNLTQDVCYDG